MDEVDSICLVRECRELEKRFEILQKDGMVRFREVKEADQAMGLGLNWTAEEIDTSGS